MPGLHRMQGTIGSCSGVLLELTSSALHGHKAPASGPRNCCWDTEEGQGDRDAPIRYMLEESLLVGVVHQGA